MTVKPSVRMKALAMLEAGLATQSEVAELIGVSRQLVRKWALAERIDAVETRRAWLQAAWKRIK